MAGDIDTSNANNCQNATCDDCCTPVSSCIHPAHANELLLGLSTLRNQGKLFDVSLIVEGVVFKAHRVVLAACSDYFSAMFSDAMREAQQSEIHLEGVSARGIELLLDYAYTSKLDLDRNNVQDMLSVSTHVQMKSVIDACSTFLDSQIDLENCVAIATLADLYSLESLKKRCYHYISGRLSKFAKSGDLLALSWDQLQGILTSNYPVDVAEEHVLEIILQYCYDTNLKIELSRLLIANVRFSDISSCAFKMIRRQLGETSQVGDRTTNPSGMLYRLLNAERLKQEQCLSGNTLANILGIKNWPSRDILINSRGMELTLVKIGGFEPNGLTNQISCYLPSKRKWEMLTVIPHIEQCNYGTAVLGNELYVVGGSYDVCLKEYIHPFGFRYCPTKNKWKTMAPIQADRCRFSLNAMGKNHLYAVGGVCELNEHDGSMDIWSHEVPISNVERYNATTDTWEFLPPLARNRSQHAGVVVGDKLYIAGGIDRHLVLSSFDCFDTTTNTWSKLACMPTARADLVLIAIDGLIYACGGWYEDLVTELRVLADTIDVYDIERNQWTTETTNPLSKFYTGVAVVERKIYFVGGLLSSATINRATSAVQCYDLDTKTWTNNSEWEYPQEVWECTCTAFYVPSERDDFNR